VILDPWHPCDPWFIAFKIPEVPMQFSLRLLVAAILTAPAALHAQPPKTPPVAAVVESTLKTAGGQIRQFAFDGNADSYFASANNPGKDDHFTLIFDQPVALRAIDLTTGKPKGGEGDTLDAGVLESSTDGKTFEKLAEGQEVALAKALQELFAEFAQKDAQPKKADPPAKSKTPLEGEPSLRIHPVPGGNAEAIASV
jgi:hypothetical protein